MVKPDGMAEVGAPIQIYLAEEDDTLRQTCASALRAHSLSRLDIELPFVLMTRAHERSVRDTAERAGASAILLKPFPIDELVTLVRTLVDARSIGASSATAKAPSEKM
jgi:DNA-binding NarL/FixJ family response regulator